ISRGVSFPAHPQPGDVLLIHDAGGYNSSMAWPFGRGSVAMDDWERLRDYLDAPSQFGDHGAVCCAVARGWLTAMDRSCSFRSGGWHPPAWLRARYSWGPVRWPVYWCEVPAADTLDCGSLAALATELFRRRGEKAASVQLILRYH